MTAMYHLLLTIKDFDVAIHVQNSILLNINLNRFIEEFITRTEILAAPKLTSDMGVYIETGLMMLKPDAVKQYVSAPLRPSLSLHPQMNVEEEAFHLFKNSWWNFLPNVLTIRKNDSTIINSGTGPFDLSDEEFLQLPAIMTSHHAPKNQIEQWIKATS